MPVHTIESHLEESALVDGVPVGFSCFDPDARPASGVDLLEPPSQESESWFPAVGPIVAKDDDEDYDDDDDDDDDDLWDDDDEDDDDDDFDDDDEDDFDDEDDDPFILDDDEDDDF
ncbi:MAG: hypothetical protein ACIAQF_11160 [Phycisphaerales bacterium JB065]